MGNILQAGVKKDDHGDSRNQQPQAASVVVDQFQASAAERAPNQATSMLKNCKKNSATDGGGSSSRTDILRPAAESHHPSPPLLPEGLQFVLNTSPVEPGCVGDGDGFTCTAFMKKAQGVAAVSGYKMAGDTNNRDPLQYRIRMRGIDAPELQMKYGVKSKNELVKLIGGKRVVIYVYGKDQFERYLGDIYCDGVFIQEQMLKRGFAWHFKTYDKRRELAQLEREAREARRGLWLLDNPQKPWEWRKIWGLRKGHTPSKNTPVKEAPEKNKKTPVKKAPRKGKITPVKKAPKKSKITPVKKAPEKGKKTLVKKAPEKGKKTLVKKAPEKENGKQAAATKNPEKGKQVASTSAPRLKLTLGTKRNLVKKAPEKGKKTLVKDTQEKGNGKQAAATKKASATKNPGKGKQVASTSAPRLKLTLGTKRNLLH